MRTLKYAILGLLNREPLTGYDIARAFEQELGEFWSAGHSQIYPELRRLTEEGLVSFDTEIQGERLERKRYSLTGAGRADFRKWLLEDVPLGPTPKDVFRLKVYLSDAMGEGDLTNHLRTQMALHKRRLEYLRSEPVAGRPVESLDPREKCSYMVLRSAILREEAYVRWLEECLDMTGARET